MINLQVSMKMFHAQGKALFSVIDEKL